MSHPPETLQLAPSQQALLWLPAGQRIVVEQGGITVIHPVRWLGERCVAIQTRVAAGGAADIEDGGWVTLAAPAGADLRLPRPTLLSRLGWPLYRPCAARESAGA